MEEVVLVNEGDEVIGTLAKDLVHTETTPLHRGFSTFVFNKKGKVLIQKRSNNKKTWGGFWSNSFCGHPQLNESYGAAMLRRADFELGIHIRNIKFISKYRYSFMHNNIFENEICPIYVAKSDDLVKPNLDEVNEIAWLYWNDFVESTYQNFTKFTPWCIEEIEIVKNSKFFTSYTS